MRSISTKHPVLWVSALVAVVVLWCFGYRAYNELYNKPLDTRLMADFKIEQVPSGTPVTLKISGRPIYPAMVVRSVTTETRGSVLFVTPRLALNGLAKPITQGKFEYQFVVPDSIDEVRFGKSAATVWRRRNNHS